MGNYERIERAIKYIEANAENQPALDDIAAHIGLSPYHFQKLFTDWAGISPKRFMQCLTIQAAKKLLDESRPVLDAALDVGLSSPSRLHDLFVGVDAVTPGEYKSMGAGLEITYGFQPTPFGDCLTALTERGVCGLYFLHDTDETGETERLRAHWQNAKLTRNDSAVKEVTEKIFSNETSGIKIFMKGTNFQIKVWTAVLNLPAGVFASYGDVACMINMPKASRAVGTALGQNGIGYLIPCHRVLRETGAVTGYRWGTERKKAMMIFESAIK
ncbi:bifunctional transcriptional activator/DNA repair enzyme AdaA [Seleniivibrio woodruffii]|uniref:bifunctional transcriptional activator/DNA repair enzyme AdaA n=1 Tax=Seleniivibrio woodruffii TaxID=1078050 RepID=UPI0026F2A69B|nr:methylated-DNA--[protein]-cysteine S-methyltransferase [Seleniivibrio woodruffii]